MLGTPPSPTCTTPYCGCGRCYSPGSLVGDWVRRWVTGIGRLLRRAVLRRPHRFEYDAAGAVLVPAWVPLMWSGRLIDEDPRPR